MLICFYSSKIAVHYQLLGSGICIRTYFLFKKCTNKQKEKETKEEKRKKRENKGDKEKENVVVVNSIYGKSNVIRYRL